MQIPSSTQNKKLYCVAYEKLIGKKWVPGLEYMHAKDASESVLHLGGNIRGRFGRLLGKDIRIVGVAPVIGAFALDNHAEKLIV